MRRLMNESNENLKKFSDYIQKEIADTEKSISKRMKYDYDFENAGRLGSAMYHLAALKIFEMAIFNAERYIPEEEQCEWIITAVNKNIRKEFPFEKFAIDGIQWFCNDYIKDLRSFLHYGKPLKR